MRCAQGDAVIGSYIKVSKPKGKDGDGERWAMGGVSPTMNVFENQTSTRATVVIVKCYENHAQDARVREIQGGVCHTIGASNANGMGTSGNNPLILWKPKERHTR